MKLQQKIRQFLHDEGALMVLQASRGDGGTIFAQSGGPYEMDKPVAIPGVVLMPEQYNRIARLSSTRFPSSSSSISRTSFTRIVRTVSISLGKSPAQGRTKTK